MSDSKEQDLPTGKSTSNLQDINRLIIDAVIQLTNIIETMHHRISPLSRLTQSKGQERALGISGLVYRGVRNITELVGKTIDLPLGVISKTLGNSPLSVSQSAFLSALNGVLGDHLERRQSPLAITMTFKQYGEVIDVQAVAQAIVKSKGKLNIMVHGLCMNDEQWQRGEHNHGRMLEQDLGHTTIYLHYNSGRHISDNGQQFSDLLESLTTQIQALTTEYTLEISIVAHSMGGLVARSAHHHGKVAGQSWPEYLQRLVFLGTPHHGAPLEKAGNWIDLLLGIHHYTAPLTRITQIRSAGITDLRHGNIIESDWQPRSRFDFTTDKRTPLPLPEGVDCFTIATTSSAKSNLMSEQLVGDGLVPLDSALGRHSHKPFSLKFEPDKHWVSEGINHMELLSDKRVYAVIRQWLTNLG